MSDISLDEATLWQVEQGYDITDDVAFHGPPGTGKTTTAAATVGRLVRDHEYEIGDVAWVTYRRSLATDTLERLAEWGVLDSKQLKNPRRGATRMINTAHAVGNRAADIGEEPVKEWQRNDFCQKRDMQYWTGEPWEDSAGKLLFTVFDYLAQQHTTPEDEAALYECPHLEDLREHWNGDVLSAWDDWQDYKAQRDLIDFHEMLKRPLEQGATPGRRILVVDEYHDATQLMHDLFEFWMQDAEIVLVAGDPHQVVNAFDGASPEYFESLDLPKVLLPTSFRCPNEHWQVATHMLKQAHEPPEVERVGSGLVNEWRSPRFEYSSEEGWSRLPGENQEGAPAFLADRFDEGTSLFLTRTQMQADGVGAALERAGVPYRSQKDLKGWNTENGEQRLHLYNSLRKLEGYTPANFDNSTAAFSQFTGAQKDPEGVELSNQELCALIPAVHAKNLDITRSEADDRLETREDTEGSITLSEFDNWVTREFWERFNAGAASVDRLNKTALGSPGDARRERRALKSALAAREDLIDPDEISISVITIHASKGMEADDVFVYDGISNRIGREMMNNESTRRNEWRTWYVACSRARKRLHILRGGFEWTNNMIPTDLRERVAE